MNQFGLIIQETTAGSNQQFVSSHLDINNPEIKETITDERTLASQLANLSDVYSVQVTKNYKVYSLIVTNLTDFLGRSGYYAIRLYGPKGVNLTNFESILANIKVKFNNYTISNTLNNQNYEDILSSILIVENDRKNIVALKSPMNFFYYFDDLNSTLSTVFNTKGVHLVHKIYAFNKNKAVNESIALSSGLKSFSQINASLKEINIVNNYGVLNELKINDQLVDFDPNLTEFNVLCQNNDILVYNSKDDKTYKPISNNFISIVKKIEIRQQPQNTHNKSTTNKKKNNENAMYLISGFMVLLIGSGMFYFIGEDTPPDVPVTVTGSGGKGTEKPPKETKVKGFEFQKRKNEITSNFEYTTNYPKLKKYVFSYGGDKKWSFSNTEGRNIMGDFYKKTLNDFDLTSDEKQSLVEKLEKISGHPILEEADTKNAANSENENKAATTPKNNDTQKENTKVKQIKSKVKPVAKKVKVIKNNDPENLVE